MPEASVDDRLVVQLELVAVDGPLQVGDQLVTLDHSDVHVRVEALHPVLARRLGGGHGDVGVAQQLVGPPSGVAHGDADRRSHLQLVAVDDDRLADGLEQRLGDVLGDARLGAVEEHPELVAAETGGRVLGTEHLPDATGERDQQLVADGVAEGVVDDLEVVDADEQDGEPARRRRPRTPAPSRLVR